MKLIHHGCVRSMRVYITEISYIHSGTESLPLSLQESEIFADY